MKNYYLFLDESGHHGIKTKDQQYPVLVLCGCFIKKDYFDSKLTDKFNKLKLKYFKTTKIVLHSRDIRKWQNEFKILGDPKIRNEFYKDLDGLIASAEFNIITTAILKDKLIEQYGPRTDNPYELSLTFILERTTFLSDNIGCKSVEMVAEARGKKEDASLHNQHQLILSHGTAYVDNLRLRSRFSDIKFVKKAENNLGTQIADLVAYPLATKALYPERENLAFRVIEPKIYRQFLDGDYLGYGLKIFP